jgi:hypothetical protein
MMPRAPGCPYLKDPLIFFRYSPDAEVRGVPGS